MSFLNQFSNLGLGFFQCSPYHIEDKALIMGDAAHAMLPFLAQGVNSVRHVLHFVLIQCNLRYTGLFSPREIFAFQHLQKVSPSLEFAQTQFF